MNNHPNRLFALVLALLLFVAPLSAQAASLWADLLSDYNNEQSSQGGVSLIDTSDDDEFEEPAATAVPTATAVPVSATAVPVVQSDLSSTAPHIRDLADLFTPAQEEMIEERIAKFQASTGMDFVVMTSDKPHPGMTAQHLADDYYDYGNFGLDAENSGIAYYIDMDERYHYLSTTGQMINYMTDARIDTAIDRNTSYLSSGQYANAVLNMMDLVEGYYRKGIPEGQYQYDSATGQMLTSPHKALTGGELGVSGIIALIIGIIFNRGVHSSYTLKGSTYKYSVKQNTTLNMTNTEDTFLRTTTTRVRKPDPVRTSGGGFGGGGGSGVHIGSSGSSHGGGGGRF